MEIVRQVSISSKRSKTLENEEEDRLSALPDCLIIKILSLLHYTEDAIRTGILSRRWKSLWTWISTLRFIFCGFKDPIFLPDFVSSVEKTLAQCPQSNLAKFTLSMHNHMRFETQINSWIRYATNRNVQDLHLMLLDLYMPPEFPLEEQYFVNSCFTRLTLGGCLLNPNGAICWKMLTSLCLWGAILSEDLIHNILSGSPMLETLELYECYGYSLLDVTSKSVKKLLFRGYRNLNNNHASFTDVIKINAPNILSLEIGSALCLWKLLLVDVSSLVKAKLDFRKSGYYYTSTIEEDEEETLKGLIQSLGHVKVLQVRTNYSEVLDRLKAKGFRSPSNIKFFEVEPVKPWYD